MFTALMTDSSQNRYAKYLNLSTTSSVLFPVLASLLLASVAQADQYGVNHPQFTQNLSAALTAALTAEQAQANTVVQANTVFVSGNVATEKLSPGVLAKLEAVARDQANIWADTILEGPYEADGATRIDRVEVLSLDQKPIAYRITYSERGWFVGDCEYDYSNRDLLKKCQTGRVVESSFVSPDFSTWMRDDLAYAEFKN